MITRAVHRAALLLVVASTLVACAARRPVPGGEPAGGTADAPSAAGTATVPPDTAAAARSRAEREAYLSDATPFTFLASSSYLLHRWPDSAYYEGNISVPVFLRSRTGALRSFLNQDVARRTSGCIGQYRESPKGRPSDRWKAEGCTLTFTPRFVVRQLSSESAPVRTPSFNPGVDFTWLQLSAPRARGALAPDPRRGARLLAISLRAAHYSNGQTGCLLANSTPDPADRGRCVPNDTSQIGDVLNTEDGSFSSNYLEPAVTVGHLRFADDATDRFTALGSLAVRWYPNWSLGHMDRELASRYRRVTGIARVESRINYEVPLPRLYRWPLRHRQQVVLGGEMECADRKDPYQDCRGAAEVALAFPGAYGFGVLLRRAWGWDYYNIAFRNPVSNGIAIGITLRHAQPTWFGDEWQHASALKR